MAKKAKKLTDSERIDAIIAAMQANGWTLPKGLAPEKEDDTEEAGDE